MEYIFFVERNSSFQQQFHYNCVFTFCYLNLFLVSALAQGNQRTLVVPFARRAGTGTPRNFSRWVSYFREGRKTVVYLISLIEIFLYLNLNRLREFNLTGTSLGF